jgi:hypothetical protein
MLSTILPRLSRRSGTICSKIAGHKLPHQAGLKGEFVNPAAVEKRRAFARLSIAVGNALQTAGILAACFALRASESAHLTAIG